MFVKIVKWKIKHEQMPYAVYHGKLTGNVIKGGFYNIDQYTKHDSEYISGILMKVAPGDMIGEYPKDRQGVYGVWIIEDAAPRRMTDEEIDTLKRMDIQWELW